MQCFISKEAWVESPLIKYAEQNLAVALPTDFIICIYAILCPENITLWLEQCSQCCCWLGGRRRLHRCFMIRNLITQSNNLTNNLIAQWCCQWPDLLIVCSCCHAERVSLFELYGLITFPEKVTQRPSRQFEWSIYASISWEYVKMQIARVLMHKKESTEVMRRIVCHRRKGDLRSRK